MTERREGTIAGRVDDDSMSIGEARMRLGMLKKAVRLMCQRGDFRFLDEVGEINGGKSPIMQMYELNQYLVRKIAEQRAAEGEPEPTVVSLKSAKAVARAPRPTGMTVTSNLEESDGSG